MQGWAKATPAMRKRLLRRTIKEIVVTQTELLITFSTSSEDRDFSPQVNLQGENSTEKNNIISLGRRKRPSAQADERGRAMTSGTVPDSAAEAAGENLKCAVGENQNSLVRSSGNDKIGSPLLRTCNYYQIHDFVELFQEDISRIFEICSPLYLQGHSLTEVSNLTGFAWTTIRNQLVKGGVTLRPNKAVKSSEILHLKFRSSTPPPYGYVYLEGQLQKDQKEFPVLQIIWNQWRLGQSATNITHYLNDKKIKTRNHGEWKRTTLINILERFENKTITL